jgi:hypothetical protein
MGARLSRRDLLLTGALGLGGWIAVSCGESISTRVVPIAQRLPEREEALYRILDAGGRQQGTALLGIAPQGDLARLTLEYDFGLGRRDSGAVLVRSDTMKPVRAERTVVDGDRHYVTRIEYNDKVTAQLEDGTHTRLREAALTETAYDNLAALFLWRTMDHSVGTMVRYTNVVVDPKRGSISRVLGTAEVIRREAVSLPSGDVQAWQVDFRSAGVTNSAWYRADSARPLVRYVIARGPTLLLDSVRV